MAKNWSSMAEKAAQAAASATFGKSDKPGKKPGTIGRQRKMMLEENRETKHGVGKYQ